MGTETKNITPVRESSPTGPFLICGSAKNLIKNWSLTISGLVDSPKMFSWDDFMSLPKIEDVPDFHCVTAWSHLNNHWVGADLWIS